MERVTGEAEGRSIRPAYLVDIRTMAGERSGSQVRDVLSGYTLVAESTVAPEGRH